MQDVTLHTLTLLLLKQTWPQVLGIPTSRWAQGQVHSKGEAREPWHLFIPSLGEGGVQIFKFHLSVKLEKLRFNK